MGHGGPGAESRFPAGHTLVADIVCDSQRRLARYYLPSTSLAHGLELARASDSHWRRASEHPCTSPPGCGRLPVGDRRAPRELLLTRLALLPRRRGPPPSSLPSGCRRRQEIPTRGAAERLGRRAADALLIGVGAAPVNAQTAWSVECRLYKNALATWPVIREISSPRCAAVGACAAAADRARIAHASRLHLWRFLRRPPHSAMSVTGRLLRTKSVVLHCAVSQPVAI